MTAIRGPGPEPKPLLLSMGEMALLVRVKQTPYMDEPDLPDPSWVIPDPLVLAPPVQPLATIYINWYRAMFGKNPPGE